MCVRNFVIVLVCSVVIFLAFESFSQAEPRESGKSYEKMATAKFNKMVKVSAKNKKPWPKFAILVALKFVGESIECSSRIIKVKSSPEGFDTAMVTITDQGCLDDSIKGLKFKLQLEKNSDGIWKITGAFKAWNCWRGHKDFSTEPCH